MLAFSFLCSQILVNPDPLPGVKELFSEPARKGNYMKLI